MPVSEGFGVWKSNQFIIADIYYKEKNFIFFIPLSICSDCYAEKMVHSYIFSDRNAGSACVLFHYTFLRTFCTVPVPVIIMEKWLNGQSRWLWYSKHNSVQNGIRFCFGLCGGNVCSLEFYEDSCVKTYFKVKWCT